MVGSFPLNWRSPRVDPQLGRPFHIGGRPFSALARLLPHLDQDPLFNSINFDVETFPEFDGYDFRSPQNVTAYSTTITAYVCPSDGTPTPHGCNYRGNYGVGPGVMTTRETYDSGNGFYSFPGVLGPASFPDGLSHTVAYSERLCGTGAGGVANPARDFGNILVAPLCTDRDADYALQCCRLASTKDFPAFREAGFTWFFGDFAYSSFVHAQEPNGRIPDALDVSQWIGVATARSQHAGGVNALMGDGSVRFMKDSIAHAVWRALGTRNGDELVE